MQEKIIEEIQRIIGILADDINKDEQQNKEVADILKLYQLLEKLKQAFPENVLSNYIEFLDSLEIFLGNCGSEVFLSENIEMLLSSLELLSECMEEIKNYFDSHSKKCTCCSSQVLYLPLPAYYEQMKMKYGVKKSGKGETINKEEYLCPVCGASDRDRLIISFLQKEGLQKAAEGYRVLQIAPAATISSWIQIFCPQVKYETTDLFMEGVTFKTDIQNMKEVWDETYDLIICSHVLEHVQDDKAALREIRRILKDDGKCVFLVPILLDYEGIDEEWGLSEEENWRRFGQGDHCRKYGKNALVERLEESFYVNQLGKDYFGNEVFGQQGLIETSTLYVLTKNSDVSINMAEQIQIDQNLLENGPLVSVIMSCYNHEQFVEQAILSVLNQSYKNIEFIVADDGSSDHSADIMKKYSKYYSYEYYSEKNTGGLWGTIKRKSTGKYIALMNSDDIWEKNKIALQVDYMEKHPECGVCVTWCNYIDENEKEINDTIFIKENRSSYQWMNYFWKHGNAMCNPSYLATREFGFKKVHFGAACRQLPDFFKWVQYIQETQIYVMPKVLVKMRRHHTELVENVSAATKENLLRHALEEGCNWMWIIRQMEKEFFKKSFSDLMVNPNAETDEEIMCEKYFLLRDSKNFAIQYEAFCYINEIYADVEVCLKEKYNYDYRSIAKDIVDRGIGRLIQY